MVESYARTAVKWGALLMMLSVIFGALGAHALEKVLDADQLDSYETAVRYQVYHALALLIVSRFQAFTKWTRNLMIAGTLMFSGSIYILVLDELMGVEFSFLGPVTPIGGLLLIASWLMLFINIIGEKSTK